MRFFSLIQSLSGKIFRSQAKMKLEACYQKLALTAFFGRLIVCQLERTSVLGLPHISNRNILTTECLSSETILHCKQTCSVCRRNSQSLLIADAHLSNFMASLIFNPILLYLHSPPPSMSYLGFLWYALYYCYFIAKYQVYS